MLLYALKMLIGDRAKYIGIIFGLSFASFIIAQQAAIFVGLMTRTYGFITDTSQPDIWVMDRKVQYVDDIKPLKDTYIYRVKGVEGVQWAVPMYKGLIKARLKDGNFQTCIVIGLDDATLIGGPPRMIAGNIKNLKWTDAVIVNEVGAKTKLAQPPKKPGKEKIPLQMGDVLEINDNRAKVAGICKVSRTFQSQPVIYTTYNRALSFAPPERKLLSFILVKAEDHIPLQELCHKIERTTGLAAYTSDQFIQLTIKYFMKNTGIPLNFGVAVLLGFIIGTAIAGQTFYNFTLDNLPYFGAFKAMGAGNWLLMRMVFLQAMYVGAIGWGIGIGAASLFGFLSKNTELSFYLHWQLYLLSGISIFIICVFSAVLSMVRIFRLEPAVVFKG
ncbi:MAG: ABC transporter permease [Simkaniaceae bacterium]